MDQEIAGRLYGSQNERIHWVNAAVGAVATETCQAEDWQFTKTGLMALCPTISKSSVENAIKKLIEEGILVKHGSGRAVYYTRSDAE